MGTAPPQHSQEGLPRTPLALTAAPAGHITNGAQGRQGLWFWKLHQGSLGRNAPLKTGILTESWEGFWNSAISGEQPLRFHPIFKGI